MKFKCDLKNVEFEKKILFFFGKFSFLQGNGCMNITKKQMVENSFGIYCCALFLKMVKDIFLKIQP